MPTRPLWQCGQVGILAGKLNGIENSPLGFSNRLCNALHNLLVVYIRPLEVVIFGQDTLAERMIAKDKTFLYDTTTVCLVCLSFVASIVDTSPNLTTSDFAMIHQFPVQPTIASYNQNLASRGSPKRARHGSHFRQVYRAKART